MPFSHGIPAGKWRWGKLPKGCPEMLDAIYMKIFGSHAIGTEEETRGQLIVEGAMAS
jgi:hypothetical protein